MRIRDTDDMIAAFDAGADDSGARIMMPTVHIEGLTTRPEAASPGAVLVVDDLPLLRGMLRRLLTADGYAVIEASDGVEAVELARAAQPDLVLMDVRLPGRDGFSACRAIKSRPETALTPIILMTGAHDELDKLTAIECRADEFLTKPVNRAELRARVQSLVRVKHHTDELDSAASVVLSLGLTVEARDPHTHGHCQRLARYGRALGRRLGLGNDDLRALQMGGYLHDLGKIALPDALLLKPGRLTESERAAMCQHTIIGERLCGDLRVLRHVRPIIRHHHERPDGSGYPDGLRGSEIPLLAAVISIVDAYDALTTDRPYRAALSSDAALNVIRDEVRVGLRDGRLFDAWTRVVRSGALDDPIPALEDM